MARALAVLGVALLVAATAGSAEPSRLPAVPGAADVTRARAFARSRAGEVTFAVVDSAGRLRCHNCRTRYPTASLVKAMLLVAHLRALAAEGRPLSAYDRRLLGEMIRVSDNDAATSLYSRVGDAGLERLARAARMPSFEVHGYWSSARVDAADTARFFSRLDGLLPPRFRAYARGLLASIAPSQTWGIPDVARPRGWHVLFKYGWDEGFLHQGARLEHGRRRMAIAVLTAGNPSFGYGRATVQGIASRLLARRD